MKEPIYIIDGLRTALGKPYRSLKDKSLGALSAKLFHQIVLDNNIKKELLDEVIFGNTVSAGTGQNFIREALALAKFPLNIPGYVVNNVCGASLQSVVFATQAILSQNADLVIAGGAESASQSPFLFSRQFEEKSNPLKMDSLFHDGLTCSISKKLMGELCEDLAQKQGIPRSLQDLYALQSHRKACRARAEGKFMNEIVPLDIGRERLFYEDEGPRKNISIQSLESLPAAFTKDGSITAGNSSSLCDGAAALLIASQTIVEKEKLIPRARIKGYSSIAIDPLLTFTSGVKAIKKCLDLCQVSIEDIDLFEICESFASQAIYMKEQLNIPDTQMNILGGDLALGHPLGAAGSRILVTLLHSLISEKKKRGLCCICFGGGGSIAMLIEIEG